MSVHAELRVPNDEFVWLFRFVNRVFQKEVRTIALQFFTPDFQGLSFCWCRQWKMLLKTVTLEQISNEDINSKLIKQIHRCIRCSEF